MWSNSRQRQLADGKELVHFCANKVIQPVNGPSLVIAVSSDSEDNRVIVCEPDSCNALPQRHPVVLSCSHYTHCKLLLLWLQGDG